MPLTETSLLAENHIFVFSHGFVVVGGRVKSASRATPFAVGLIGTVVGRAGAPGSGGRGSVIDV